MFASSLERVALAMVLVTLGACGERRTGGKEPPAVATRPVTTDGQLAMTNLETALRAAESSRDEARGPADCTEAPRLRHRHARITGDIEAMGRALEESRACAARFPASPQVWLTVAVHAQTMHRFDEATSALGRAASAGASPAKIAPIERELAWSRGEWDAVASEVRLEATRAPSAASIARLARLEHDLGDHERSDTLFAKAIAMLEEPDPIPVAMLELQRGIALLESVTSDDDEHKTVDEHARRARLTRAAETFRVALARLPRYVAAKEHLAETLSRLGQTREALILYEEVVRESNDPELWGALAALRREAGQPVEADALRERARARYEVLLARYPEAMAWHAAEFFLGEGNDPARAVALLRANVSLRPNPESRAALARAERAANWARR